MKTMRINFNNQGEFALSTGKEYMHYPFGYVNAGVTFEGENEAQLDVAPQIPASSFFHYKNTVKKNGKTQINYTIPEKSVDLQINVTEFDGINAVYQTTDVIGQGEKHVLTQLAAANVNYVCYDNGEYIKDRLSDGSILIHICQNKWQGEGQWKTFTPDDLGVYYASEHSWERDSFRLDSASSWSTGVYFPLIIIEDKKNGECWFFEIEAGHSWFFEIYACSGVYTRFLSVKMGGADEKLGFAKNIENGISYSSCGCVYGVTKGGFEEAVRELVKYKRASSIAPCGCPLTFNDYMNCNWAYETQERLIGLIDRASEAGAEIFCIDDGWQTGHGLWFVENDRFGDMGLQGILDYIRSKGMIAGVWFEFETVPLKLAEILGSDDIFLYRHKSVLAKHRPLGNFRSEILLNYLRESVEKLYNMGVRFIKNDHNNHEFIGTDMYGESPGEGLEKNNEAFLAFINELYARYPDLIIENCGCGANRSDWGTLKHFCIQSISDQEDYVAFTSVLSGSLALMPPEKAGIWSYPYPLNFNDRELNRIPEEKVVKFKDGEQTVFNMVNGMLGGMYLSGRIDQMDDYNFALFKEGTALYKDLYPFIKSAYPVWPLGRKRLCDRTENAVGLINEDNSEMILAVWNLSDKEREIKVDLKKYGMNEIEIIYPSKVKDFAYEYRANVLDCKFQKGASAKLFRLKK